MQQNSSSAYLALPTGICFNHALLADSLQSYHSVRDKIALMLKKGEIIRIRRGLYARSQLCGGTIEPMKIANLVYGPSYISLEYALSYYGMIPERVESVTCITTKRSKKVSTPIGNFSYEHVPLKAFAAGIALDYGSGSGILIATREKAICDRIALAANIRTASEIEAYIMEDLRIDEEVFSKLSINLLDTIASGYGLQRVSLFAKWYRKKNKEIQ